MERKILFIGVRQLFSKKQERDFYMVDYVDEHNVPQTDYISVEEYNRIAMKTKDKSRKELIGIFGVTPFNKIYLNDIKA